MSVGKDDTLLICISATMKQQVSSARIYRCADCGQDIWATPASLVAAGPEAKLVCMACVGKLIEDTPDSGLDIHPPTEGQIKEMKDALGLR